MSTVLRVQNPRQELIQVMRNIELQTKPGQTFTNQTNTCQKKQSCSSHYALSFLIPFLSTLALYSIDVLGSPSGYVEAITAALLAGSTGFVLYKSIKYVRHQLPGHKH